MQQTDYTFLEYVAADLLRRFGTSLSRVAVVFPGKRAALFMNEYLARLADGPVWSPSYVTISDLFRAHSSLTVADPIQAVCLLHRVYTEVTGLQEPLDHFYGWGQTMLADFDDIDKHLADAHRVFANVRDLHALDRADYLDEAQRAALRGFFATFRPDHDSRLREKFLHLWNRLERIYHVYNDTLAHRSLAYEGALYREVATGEDADFQYDAYAFVGFSMLQPVEQALFRRIQAEGKALFYWDFDEYMLQPGNEAGHFIRQYLADFPCALDRHNPDIYCRFARPKRVAYVAASTETAQARYIPQWLAGGGRTAAGRRAAVVLADEHLLLPVIHSIPASVQSANITTGYPLAMAPVSSLLSLLTRLWAAGPRTSYRVSTVLPLLRHPLAAHISPQCASLASRLLADKTPFPTRSLLSLDEGLTLLFSPPGEGTESLVAWMREILTLIGRRIRGVDDPFLSESVFRMYTVLTRLLSLIQGGDLVVEPATLGRLLRGIVATTTIPFHGRPAEGLQVMGLLETRCLDFDHLLILSANDSNLPGGASDTSFIPYAVRRAYGLTTTDHKVAVRAYYFYRLLSRASNVTILYNASTSGGHTGEMSRFMTALLAEGGFTVSRLTLRPGRAHQPMAPAPVPLTPETAQRLDAIPRISPTAINSYLRCPLIFYYQQIERLREPDAEPGEMDARAFGNVFHASAQSLYTHLKDRNGLVTPSAIDGMLAAPHDIERIVDDAMRSEVFGIEDDAPMPPLGGLQLIQRRVITDYVRRLLERDRQRAPFTILLLEQTVGRDITLTGPGGRQRTIRLSGQIDRLDLVTDDGGRQRIRVIDYKTGAPPTSPLPDIPAMFSAATPSACHPDYYLQALFYSLIVSHDARLNPQGLPVTPSLLFIQGAGAADYDPTLLLGSKDSPERMLRATDYEQEYLQGLRSLLADIFCRTSPFEPTAAGNHCERCAYRRLCYQKQP